MYGHFMVETLSGTLNAIFLGGNVYNVLLHVNAATLQRANIFYFVYYIMQFQKIIVYKIFLGGRGSIASSRHVFFHGLQAN